MKIQNKTTAYIGQMVKLHTLGAPESRHCTPLTPIHLCIYQVVVAHTDLLGLAHFLNTCEALEPHLQPVAALYITVALPGLVCGVLGSSVRRVDTEQQEKSRHHKSKEG